MTRRAHAPHSRSRPTSRSRSVVTALVRPALALPFVLDGIDAARHPEEHLERFERVEPLLVQAGLPPMMRSDAKALTRLSGIGAAAAGVAFSLGIAPRLTGAALLAACVPVRVVNNPIWTARDDQERARYRSGLLGGAAVGAGLLSVVVAGH